MVINPSTFRHWTRSLAAGTMVLRGGVVGGNFAVMIGLAAYLGLAEFGRLSMLWGIALVASTGLSLGGPLILLRAMTDGHGIKSGAIPGFALLLPAALALGAYFPLQWIWPALPWGPILLAALGMNALSCLGSVMRGLGSIRISMVLRDAGPQLALGVVVLGTGAAPVSMILSWAAVLMCSVAIVLILWAMHRAPQPAPSSGRLRLADGAALWGTSVLGVGVAQMDLIAGGFFLPPEVLGLYALLRRVANLTALPVSVATWVSAAPIAAAFGAGDLRGLQRESVLASRIALTSGVALLACGLVGLLCLPVALSPAEADMAQTIFLILLIGAFVQVWYASGFTVATLCGFAHFAGFARAATLCSYLLGLILAWPALGPVGNALLQAAAMSAGSALLWLALRRQLGVDTSAAALWRREAVAWKTS